MSKKILAYLTLLFAVASLTNCVKGRDDSDRGSTEKNDQALKSFVLVSGSNFYHPAINYEEGRINVGGIARGMIINEAKVGLEKGASISPDPASRLGSWGKNEEFTVTSAAGVQKKFTVTLTDYDEDEEVVLFYDDFSKPELDRTKWDIHFRRHAEGVSVEEGNLVIKLIKDGDTYKAGGVTTLGKFALKFGKVEVRAKFVRDLSQGELPAIWMMPVPGQCKYGERNPMGGEIDIMERVKRESFVTQTVHSSYTVGDESIGIAPHRGLGIHYQKSFITGKEHDWHVYGCEITPTQIKLYTDGVLIFTYNKLEERADELYQWPFDVYFYLNINNADGMTMGGGDPIDAELPAQMNIDWVKITANEWNSLESFY